MFQNTMLFCVLMIPIILSMSDGQSRHSLPKIEARRLHTESIPYRQHRLSQHVYQSRQISRDNSTVPVNPQKIKQKQISPYSKKSHTRFDDQLLSKIQCKISLDQKIRNKLTNHTNKSLMEIVYQKTEPAQYSFANNNIVLSEVQNFYHNKVKGKAHDSETFSQFMHLLRQNNPLVQKINPILFETLLKLGSIATYHPGQTIYKQGVAIRNLGILLWGHTLLRKKTTKFRFNCYPGAAFGEEMILEKMGYNSGKGGQVNKGEFMTFERCKVVAESGVLFIGEREYRWLSEQLALQGLKQVVLCFQRLIQRTYLRKREQRQLYG